MKKLIVLTTMAALLSCKKEPVAPVEPVHYCYECTLVATPCMAGSVQTVCVGEPIRFTDSCGNDFAFKCVRK